MNVFPHGHLSREVRRLNNNVEFLNLGSLSDFFNAHAHPEEDRLVTAQRLAAPGHVREDLAPKPRSVVCPYRPQHWRSIIIPALSDTVVVDPERVRRESLFPIVEIWRQRKLHPLAVRPAV